MSTQLTGIGEAHHQGAKGKTDRGISNPCGQMGSSRSLTKTNHAIHCDPAVSPNFFPLVCNMPIKAAVACNATAQLTYHDVRRSFIKYALSVPR